MITKLLKLPLALIRWLIKLPRRAWRVLRYHLPDFISFNILLQIYVLVMFLRWLAELPMLKPFLLKPVDSCCQRVYSLASRLFKPKDDSINRMNLIDLAMRYLSMKKSRSFITVGGMAVGIGAIVFLVSLGYGVQKLVVDRVARLEEMRQAEIAVQPGSLLVINDETLNRFNDLDNTQLALPQIAVVGRVSFQNSVSDMAVYGVTAEYLRQSAIQPVYGTIFESDDLTVASSNGKVAGVSTDRPIIAEAGEFIQAVEARIDPGVWLQIREKPQAGSKILGFTKQSAGSLYGREIWGEVYPNQPLNQQKVTTPEGQDLARWLQGEFLLWEQTGCEVGQPECELGGYQPVRRSDNTQQTGLGYTTQVNMTVQPVAITALPQVLGVIDEASSNDSFGLIAADDLTVDQLLLALEESTGSADLDLAALASAAGALRQEENVSTVELGSQALQQAVVNRAMLQVLGIQEAEAVGKEFEVSFIATSELTDEDTQLASVPETYTIIGVTPEDTVPYFYVPFIDLRSLGINNYSQVKLVVETQAALAQVRQQIEALGFSTNSVADTVAQIDQLFSTIRTVLGGLGMVALAVAALGMFNTLTVSLLERTREVGLMKTMGMRSFEVRDLFLTESMIMGFFGGALGLLLGFVGGKALGFVLSIFALTQGQGYLDVSYIPPIFMVAVFGLSILVGVLTGIYPAVRATKISPLDALRYE